MGGFGVVLGYLVECFGALGGSWGASWAVLAASWGVLGASWGVLGASWGHLGRSWVALGASWGPLGRLKSFWTQQGPARGQTYVPKGGQDGAQMGAKVCQNRTQNGSKSKTKTKTKKEALEDRHGAVLGRSWVVLGAVLGPQKPSRHYACRCFVNIHFFDVKTVRRRSWDQLWPTKAPKRPKMTPKTEPKSTPRRSKIDVKIVIKNDAKTKRAGVVLGRRHWAGTPPQGPPGRRPRDPGEAAQAPWDL